MNSRDSHLAPAGRDELADRAEVVLLTVDGADFRRVGVEVLDGVATLSGEVRTESERMQAAAVVRRIDGVHGVNNQLQVANERPGGAPGPALKDYVAALSSDMAFEGARVESLGDGVTGAAMASRDTEADREILENGSSDLISEKEGAQ